MKIKKMLDARCWMLVAAMVTCLLLGASFPLQVGSAQFIDRITRPCSSGVTSRALVITNPNNTGNVEITTCTGGSVTINGAAVVPGGATINPTNTFIPYRSNATTFLDSPLARTSATVITSTAAFNGPAGGVNTATYSFAAEPTLGWIRGAAGQLTATSAGTIGWFDTNGWHGFGTKVEVFNDTATSTDGFIATTNGNATVGVQKLSPRIRLSGSGWKTDAVAGAQMTDWIIENTPVQGTANPSTNLVFSSQVNAGGYTPRAMLDSASGLTVFGATQTGSSAVGVLTLTQTWNTSGAPAGINFNVTNTASSVQSKLLSVLVNGSNRILVTRDARMMHQYSDPAISVFGDGNDYVGSGSGAAMDLNAVDGAYHNVFFGGESGTSNTKGYQNTFIGNRAGVKNTTGAANTLIGQGAGYQNITGTGSTNVGFHAGLNVVGDGYNTFLGQSAAQAIAGSTATENVVIGQNAAYSITTGATNVIVGNQAAFFIGGGTSHTILGARSGFGASGVGATTGGSNQVLIGYETIASTPTASNEITLGNASITSFRIPGVNFYINSGNVGIGTVGPLSKLSINGGLHVGGDSDAGDNNLIVDGTSSLGVASATSYSTTTNCADSAGAAACGSAAAGAVVIDAGNTSVVVSTTAVTATSRVIVIFDSSLGTELGVTCNTTAALPFVTARTAATDFTITVGVAPAVNPGCFTYWIVN